MNTDLMRRANISSPEYELHVAAEVGPSTPELADRLREIGFTDDDLVTHGIVYGAHAGDELRSCPLTGLHMSASSFHPREHRLKQDALVAELDRFSDTCVGYAHAEVIRPEWDLCVNRKPFRTGVPFPRRPFECRKGESGKRWDIHIAADLESLDGRLHESLTDGSGMYYIDLRKPNGSIKRVFTVQGESSVSSGFSVFQQLDAYLAHVGGMCGSIKFETTYFWRVFGSPRIVPPVVDIE